MLQAACDFALAAKSLQIARSDEMVGANSFERDLSAQLLVTGNEDYTQTALVVIAQRRIPNPGKSGSERIRNRLIAGVNLRRWRYHSGLIKRAVFGTYRRFGI
jgi:hypothetical protein